ncbi:MAG: ROK family protein [Armatimonadota bacterium]|nr:ROK family protein [Armatimonadota bacterium]MDR7427787.1 ROK family protein [Armatimonadota bacterium]MDR7464025.1 ROK family protein [Armatimonadota bacterium]MDR7468909.1 ROK family protein [Armatimonadota bacterium]MDR7474850.1 ROK family protein [Armatimonadota bacterium]
MRVALAVDLGGTLLRTGLVTEERLLLHQAVQRVEDRRGNAAVEALLRAALRAATEEARARALQPVGVGLAVPGLVDPRRGVIRYSANLELRELAVAEVARQVLPLPVVVENDVRAAAWGEWRWGAGLGVRTMAYLSAGTGIAAALVHGGRLYHGGTAAAGEVGHIPVVPDGDRCRCGQRGCLETVAGGWGIVQRTGRLAAGSPGGQAGSVEMRSTEAIFQAATAGDPVACAVVREAGEFLGRAAVTAVRMWDPECLVLGGGLFFPGSPLADAVRRAVVESAFYGQEPPPVPLAAFGGTAGLMGAACLVLAPA